MREHERQEFVASRILPDWPAPPNVHAFSTTRGPAGSSEPPFDHLNLGLRSGDDLPVALGNRDSLEFHLELPPPHWLHQVHGSSVLRFEQPAPRVMYRDHDHDLHARIVAAEPQADAAVTAAPGVALAILTADCLPVLFCAKDGSEVGAAHAGWRGLCADVLENTLAAMCASREGILAWLGPAIGPQSYEVGEEVRDAFLASDGGAAEAFTPTRPGHWHCDLYALARRRLHAAGVKQTFGGGFDTFTDPRLYSYRRDGARSGRFANLIWLGGQNSR
ncbi:MAG TPA: peptidoglycan editing factor PgeF [Rhodanobacteraceae bacterium]|nr:peptidoglycan editing factor PgeF [Rhodanobacteraceae bacterium]